MTRLKYFEDWLEEAESRMKYIGTSEDTAKIILLKSWGGAELIEFMRIHAKVKFESIPGTTTEADVPADTYAHTIDKTKNEMRRLVNKTMAIHTLLTIQ